MKRYDEAGAAWMTAFKKLESSYAYVCEAGVSYYYAGDVDEALPAERRCLELASIKDDIERIGEAHRLLSDMLHKRGVYDEAASHAREAISLDPESAYGYYSLARALLGQRRLTEAVSSAKNAIRLSDGKYSEMHFELGCVYFELEQWPEAVQAFSKAAELAPEESSAAYNVAASYHNSQYYTEAIKWYRETLRRNPSRTDRQDILRAIDRLSKQ
jgi:tetratricopeptide (TPR) repeat protein